MKRIISLLLALLLTIGSSSVFADENSGYIANFDDGTLGDLSASAVPTSLGTGTVTAEGTYQVTKKDDTKDPNLYIQSSLNMDREYFKYEVDFMTDDENFSHIKLMTGQNFALSPEIFVASPDSSDTTHVLKRGAWNKIILVCKNPITVHPTDDRYNAEVDLIINGVRICDGKKFVVRKTDSKSIKVPLRFGIYSREKRTESVDGKTVKYYHATTSYIDNLSIQKYHYYPSIPMPVNEPQLDITQNKVTAKANLRDASMVLAGYDADGVLKATKIATNAGETTLALSGKYDSAKVFLLDSLGSIGPVCEMNEKAGLPDMPTIACWGDSLTQGDGSTGYVASSSENPNSYPGLLKEWTNCDVKNLGVAGETAMTIAARQGTVAVRLKEDIVIPASNAESVAIQLEGYYYPEQKQGALIVPKRKVLWDPIVIEGVTGEFDALKINTTSSPHTINEATFKRRVSGEAVTVPAGTQVFIPQYDDARNADINVIFIGTNGVWDEQNLGNYADPKHIGKLIGLIQKMIDNTKNPDKYIVVGLTAQKKDPDDPESSSNRDWTMLDQAMQEAFGEHLILPRTERLATLEVLTDNGIVPTDDDLTYLGLGMVPPSIRKDKKVSIHEVHFNDIGYYEIARLIYNKMIDLDYINGVKK